MASQQQSKNIVLAAAIAGVLAVPALAQEPAAAPSPLGGLFPLIVIFAIFYFLIIRPQQKKSKEHQTMLNAIKKDDKVITSGGIYGVVTGVKGDIVDLKIAENVKVQVAKSAISSLVPEEKDKQHEEPVTPEIIKK